MTAALTRNLLAADGQLLSLDVATGRLRVGPLASTPANITVTDGLEVVAGGVLPPGSGRIEGGPVRLAGLGDDCVALVGPDTTPLAPDPHGTLAPAVAPAPFLLLSGEALATLRDLAAGSWLPQGRTAMAHPGSLTWRGRFVANLGPQAIDLRLSGAMLARPNCDEVFVLDPEARIERLRRFDPLVAYTALGTSEPLFRCLEASLYSLARVARYPGRVVILTDRALNDVEYLVPGELRSRTIHHRVASGDVLHAALARYDLPELAIARQARPLLYVDTDVIFDAPIDALLAEILVRERPCVYAEDDLRHPMDFYGGSLVDADPLARPRSNVGFSTGVIGIPDAARVADLFHSVRVIAEAVSKLAGTRQFSAYDQGFVNYIFHKLVDYDDQLLQRYETCCNGRGPEPGIRRGLAHFAGGVGNASAKLPRMAAYLSDLLGPSAAVPASAQPATVPV